VDGDYYLNTANGDWYTKTSGSWNLLTNLKGPQGTQGPTGPAGADSTVPGPAGAKGDTGPAGVNGTNGSQIYSGTTAPGAGTGVDGDFYFNTSTGDYYKKVTGAWALQSNLTGPQGPAGSGSGGTSTLYNNTARYQMVAISGQAVWCVSTATMNLGLIWSRATTTLTITHNNHQHVVGERVIVRNTNVDSQVALITAATTNTFSITCTDTGATSGAAGAYMMGFTFAHNGAAGSISGGTLSAPVVGDLQLISLRMRLASSTRAGLTYNLVVPASSTNGAGGNTSNDDVYIPSPNIRNALPSLTAVSSTIAGAVSGSYNTYQLGALGQTANEINILLTF
jgi:hypothetical protein